MTPLARLIVQHKLHPTPKNTILPSADGKGGRDQTQIEGLMGALAEVAMHSHFFDISEIYREGLLKVVADKMLEGWRQDGRFDPTLAFVPAESTWIECFVPVKTTKNQRGGFTTVTFLLRQPDGENATLSSLIIAHNGDRHFLSEYGMLPDMLALRREPDLVENTINQQQHHFLTYAALSIINSPAVFHREWCEPHRAVAREAKTKGLGQVRGWHKIRLSMTRQVAEAHGEGHVTGERCLHFVRMFTRWRLGRLEYVRDHWRGNPDLGVSLASYKVKP
jgi:hypothetical protein